MAKKTDPKQTKTAEGKRSVGQPTKYRPEYCERLIAHMAQGLSFETFGAVVGVNRDTLYEWVKAYPEFKEAKEEAFLKSQLFFEKFGVAMMAGKVEKANVTAWIFQMKNRFRWRDQVPAETPPEQKEAENALADALKILDAKQAKK